MTSSNLAQLSQRDEIVGQTISRDRMEALIAGTTTPLVFDTCNFEGVDLSRLNLSGFVFKGCSLIETALYSSALSQTSWRKCRGRQANFEAAELVDARFEQCDFNNTKWRRARLSSALFKGCKLTGANFEEVSYLGLSFEESLLVGADLRKMSFRKKALVQLDFSDADLSQCDFRETVFLGGSLRNAYLKMTRFDGADLRDVDLGGLKLVDAKLFKGATISHQQAAELVAELGLSVA